MASVCCGVKVAIAFAVIYFGGREGAFTDGNLWNVISTGSNSTRKHHPAYGRVNEESTAIQAKISHAAMTKDDHRR